MPTDAPPPGDDRRTLRAVHPAADAAEPHAAPGRPRRRPIAKMTLALLLFGGGMGIIAYAYTNRTDTHGMHQAGVPVVRPADGPIKVRPEDPGGASIPYQDTLLLNQQASDGQTGAVPKPAEPAVEFAAVRQQSTPDESADAGPTPLLPRERPDHIGERASQATGEAEATPTANASANNDAAGAGAARYRIQIAAMRDEAAARSMMKRLRQRYTAVLADRTLHVVRADLGDRGVFWRVRAGPFASRDAAGRACGRLKDQGQSCYVVSP